MHHLFKIILIVAMFVPLAFYVAHLLAVNGSTLNFVRLSMADQILLAILLLFPPLALRQMQVFRRVNDSPSEFD